MDSPCPFVYWAQDAKYITLRVDLRDVKEPMVSVGKTAFQFSAVGSGARGTSNYAFSFEPFAAINPDNSQFRIMDRQVEFELVKCKEEWWPRLTNVQMKYPWLKIDFDKWRSEDDDQEDVGDIRDKRPDILDQLTKDELGYRPEQFKKIYLFLYNLFQLVGYIYVTGVLSIRYFRDGDGALEGAYEAVGQALKFCQLLQILEILHPLFGYTKGGIFEPLIQVGGRFVILFALIECEPRMQTKPVVFYLFMVWSLVEIFRYPYYMARVCDKDIGLLTWLRYTVWIPLYPLGFLCEGVVILRNIPYFEETLRFSVSLPNKWNFAFHFPTLMRCYLLFFLLPTMYSMMSYMNRQRKQRLQGKHKTA